MATNIGPRIGIEGEKEYRKALQDIIQQTKTLGTELKAIESAYGKNGATLKQNKAAREALTKQIEAQKKALEQSKDALEKAKAATGENSTQTQKWQQAVNNATADLEKMKSTLDAMPNSLQVVGGKMEEIGGKITGIGTDMTTKVTAPIVGLGGAIIKIAADFDSQMSKVQAISGATSGEMEMLRAKAEEMGATTKFSATESGQALEYMAMAGWEPVQMADGLAGVMNLAAASGENLATTSDIVTDAITAFGLAAEDSTHFADVLAVASSSSNTNVSMMGETFKYAAPIAGALGYTVEDTALAIGLMANSSVKGSQAGTALRTIMTKLNGELVVSGKNLGTMTLNTTNADGSMREFSDILADLRYGFARMTESEKTANAEMLVGKNAMTGFLALMNASDADFEKLSANLANADGTAARMAETMNNNLNGQLTLLKSQLEGVAISLGEQLMPYVTAAVDKISQLVTWFSNLDQGTKDTIVTVAGIAAVVGPALVVVGTVISSVGKIISVIGAAQKAFLVIKPAIAAAGAAIGGLSAPVLIAAGVIAGLIAAGVLLYQNWDTVKAKAEELKQKLIEAWNTAKATVTTTIETMKTTISTTWENIKTTVSSTVDGIKTKISTTFEEAKAKVTEIFESIKSAITEKIEAAKTAVQNAIEAIKKAFDIELKFPHIDLPHLSVSGKFSLDPPSVPHFEIDWYRKAMNGGMILNGATIFGAANGKLLGGGEAGAEAVVGVNSLAGMIDHSVRAAYADTGATNIGTVNINVYGAEGQDTRKLAQQINEILQNDVYRKGAVWA